MIKEDKEDNSKKIIEEKKPELKDKSSKEPPKKSETKIDKEKFRDIFVEINSKSPSLEQVAISPKVRVTLETNLANVSVEKKENSELKYNAINYEDKKEKTYSENIKFKEENLTFNNSISRARDNPRDFAVENKQKFSFNPELEGMKSSKDDYVVKSPSNNISEFKTHDPFQRIKKEYEFR